MQLWNNRIIYKETERLYPEQKAIIQPLPSLVKHRLLERSQTSNVKNPLHRRCSSVKVPLFVYLHTLAFEQLMLVRRNQLGQPMEACKKAASPSPYHALGCFRWRASYRISWFSQLIHSPIPPWKCEPWDYPWLLALSMSSTTAQKFLKGFLNPPTEAALRMMLLRENQPITP